MEIVGTKRSVMDESHHSGYEYMRPFLRVTWLGAVVTYTGNQGLLVLQAAHTYNLHASHFKVASSGRTPSSLRVQEEKWRRL